MPALGILHEHQAFLRSFATYLVSPLTAAAARTLIRSRIERRDDLFLQAARERFFAPASPYASLLAWAQCEYRDVEVMVRQRGVEATLSYLRRAGVYLSFEEFKQGREVRRGDHTVRLRPRDLEGHQEGGAVGGRTGGTTGRSMWVAVTLDHLAAAYAPQLAVFLDGVVKADLPIVTWHLGFPSGAGMIVWTALAKLRRPAARWFSLTPPLPFWRPHRVAFSLARLLARRAGIRAPRPEYAPVERAAEVLAVLEGLSRESEGCVCITTPSCAVRLSGEAHRQGRSLVGVHFLTSGEPLTAGKAAEISAAGALVHAHYAVTEAGGSVGAPCGAPVEPDEVHLRSDALALITAPRDFGDDQVEALMLTSLLPSAPLSLLNVEMDDFAQVDERSCGCVWDHLGLKTHCRQVRSFTKLTSEGTTVLATHISPIIEQVLPQAFGGTSVDYQLVEAEDDRRLTRLYLLISPRVGPLDEATVVRRFDQALAATAGRPLGGRRPIWAQAQSIRVVRRDPLVTETGKLLPFRTLGTASWTRLDS